MNKWKQRAGAILSVAALLIFGMRVDGADAAGSASGTASSAISSTATQGNSSGAQNGAQGSGAAQPVVTTTAKSAVLAEQSTGRILYENNPHEKMYPASISKIMTELLVLEAIESGKLHFTDKISVSAHASSMGGSDIWLEPGEVMSVQDLFKAMVVNSANDAAVALGEKVAGSDPAFVNLMNQKAKQLGMNDTNFVNATGLDADNNLTSAYDVMLMSRELLKHQEIFNYTTIWMDSLRGGKTALFNTNRLIRFYQGANGLKTGSTGKAGYCLSGTAMRDGMQLIAVVMNCPALQDRFTSASALLDYGFANWSRVTPKKLSKPLYVNVLHGASEKVEAVADGSPSVVIEKGKEGSIQQKVSVAPNVMAPVVKGQVLGQVTFWIDGQNAGNVPLRAKQDVGKLTFGGAFGRIFSAISQ
ncbi:D-alanyl-D-alanine carboxypeptidase family protein [Ethanoligenens sp.]|uniref:D-alanyl-D-alanine carboxypeptidase family protein n=1 Tax=Ethanoligenens sp. TaxID=2099655 RepID=UPI0039E847E9